MAQLTYKNIQKFRYLGQDEDKGEEPSETLREKILKAFVAKQLNTNINLQEILNNKKEFKSGEKQQDISRFTSGLLTNENFKIISEEFNLKNILSSCNLNESEIELLLNKNTENTVANTDAYLNKLQNIEEKLELRQKKLEDNSAEDFSNAVPLNRHEYEEECKKQSSNTVDKLTPCLVKLKPHIDPMIPADHPLNSLPQIEEALFPKLSAEQAGVKCVGNKRARLYVTPKIKYFDKKPDSFWDMKEIPIVKSNPTIDENRVYGCSSKEFDRNEVSKSAISINNKNETKDKPDYSKPFVWTLSSSLLIPLETISKNRLELGEIKKDFKFMDYEPGIPSSTLFIKNLPHKLSPVVLVSLFGHFESQSDSRIEYRILKGKMKGQAFVKFCSVQTAIQAFSTCNGYIVEGKPIVIEYSRKLNK